MRQPVDWIAKLAGGCLMLGNRLSLELLLHIYNRCYWRLAHGACQCTCYVIQHEHIAQIKKITYLHIQFLRHPYS